MRLAVISFDLGALSLILGSAFHALPVVVGVAASVLGGASFALQIYDRLKYGPMQQREPHDDVP
jgi:hypothetical protein